MDARSLDSSHLRVAPASRGSESNERTNGRTDVAPNNDCTSSSPSATRGHVQAFDAVSVGSVIEAGFLHSGERFPVQRVGEREPIPYQLRAAVWLRDRGICQKCNKRNLGQWHLDHIVPWSAGGSDDSTNLRVLCEPCNVERSNYDDRTTFAKQPVTWWCHRCYVDPVAWRYDGPTGIHCPTHHHEYIYGDYAMACSVERIYRWQTKSGNEAPTWHQRRPIEALSVNAYCAHCGTPGLTDVAL